MTEQKSWDATSLPVVERVRKGATTLKKQYDNNLLDMFGLNTNIFSHHAFLNQCLGKLNNE